MRISDWSSDVCSSDLLISYAQRQASQKRGNGAADLPLDEALLIPQQRSEELLALDEALERLKEADPRAAQVVECRVFGGLSADETADALGITRRTVSRDWSAARAWRSEEHTSELQSLMRISYAVFCLQTKK